MESGQRRVLGAQRSAAEAVTASDKSEETRKLILRVCSATKGEFTIAELEKAMCFLSNHNSNYTNVESDDFQTLLEEVLNNYIRSVLVFADFSACFGDEEVYSLSMAMQYNLSVEALTLSGINVSDECIGTLCESLVRSRVNYLDLSNTPLEDEAGRSLAALARVNPYLRTVVVDDTLISGELLDEIDVACQYNQSNFEACGDALDVSLLKEADLGRLRQRLQQIIRALQRKVRLCVLHLFGICPYGDTCIYSHALSGSAADGAATGLSDKISKLFSSGGNWEEKLLQPPQEGAAWRSKDNPDEQNEVKLDLNRRQAIKKRLEEEKKSRKRGRKQGSVAPASQLTPAQLVVAFTVGLAAVAVVAGVSLKFWRRR